jgi:hypothetical protein
MTKSFSKVLWITAIIGTLHTLGCAASPIDDVPIHADAQDVHRQSVPGSRSKEISYRVQLAYPQSAVSEDQLKRLEGRGWSKCSGYHVGWDRYVDASHGPTHERTVFQNTSYWSKRDTLLMIAMIYYGGVTKDGDVVADPGNSDQFVAITEDHGPATKMALKLTCPK